MRRRQPRPAPAPIPTRPACDPRLGFGLYLAYAMAQIDTPETAVELDLTTAEARAASPGIVNTLSYCLEHGITGAA